MGRFFSYTLIFTMLMVAFEFMGISFLANSSLATFLGFDTNAALSGGINLDADNGLWVRILVLLGVGIGTGIVIGLITRSSIENFMVLPFITVNAIIFVDVVAGILGLAGSGVFELTPAFAMILIAIMFPIGIGYFITAMEWFRGNI